MTDVCKSICRLTVVFLLTGWALHSVASAQLNNYKNVVEEVRDKITEINLTDARQLDEDVEVGDQLGIRIENPNFTRVDVQTARQIIFQKVRDAQDRPIFSANYQGAGVSILGYPVVLDDYMPDIGAADAPFIIFGNLKQAFRFCDGDLPVAPLLDPYTVKGCLLVYLEREYFEMVIKNDAIVIGAATTNG